MAWRKGASNPQPSALCQMLQQFDLSGSDFSNLMFWNTGGYGGISIFV